MLCELFSLHRQQIYRKNSTDCYYSTVSVMHIGIRQRSVHKSQPMEVVVFRGGGALVSINEVMLHQTRLVLGWVTVAGWSHVRTVSVFNQPRRPTQPGCPSRSRQNAYWHV